jgi:uncharacterized membrane protein
VRRLAFLLAHHYPEEYDRCYRVGRVHVCARCAGLYPALFATLGLALRGQLATVRAEWAVLYLLPLPALFSWARRRLTGAPGSNPVATLTGVLLGIALGRGLFLYLRDPRAPAFWVQLAGLAAVVVAVELLRAIRRAP